MLIDYQACVLQDYQNKKKLNAVSQRLLLPTPASLRDECMMVCRERFEKKDRAMLRNFFGAVGELKEHLQAIQRTDTDKFKPLVNHLKNKSGNTDLKNSELLAWLTGFEQRPFELGKDYSALRAELENDAVEIDIKLAAGIEVVPPPATIITEKTIANTFQGEGLSGKKRRRLVPWLSAILVVGLGATYLSGKMKTPSLTGNENKCMVWDLDHYEQVGCQDDLPGVIKLPLDEARARDFRLITRQDTITQNSLHKIWYVKKGDRIDCFTSHGYDPVSQKALKPLTLYMFNKYIVGLDGSSAQTH